MKLIYNGVFSRLYKRNCNLISDHTIKQRTSATDSGEKNRSGNRRGRDLEGRSDSREGWNSRNLRLNDFLNTIEAFKKGKIINKPNGFLKCTLREAE